MLKTKPLAAMCVMLMGSTGAWAEAPPGETPEEQGLAIAQEADRRGQGFEDMQAKMEMILRNKQGDESHRDLRIKTLEMENDGDKSLTIFDSPPDQRGTALLTHAHPDSPDDQWLYLPALKRVKRIASKNKSGPFMGSEFAFEDMTPQEVEKYEYKYLREEPCPNEEELQCFVVERYPTDENSGYTKQIAWIDQNEYRTWQVEFYDRKKSHLKTLVMGEYEQYEDQFWRPDKMVMTNHQTGKSTVLKWKDIEFGVGLSDAQFRQNALRRIR